METFLYHPTPEEGAIVGTNLLETLNDWTVALDNKQCIDVILLDFTKAFDKVSHSKLLFKISKLGFHENVYKWMKAFLTGRTYQERVNASYSNIFSSESEIPQ
ncbi:hypothetical protein COOONC_28592, partial [Cooperia oncophora]